MTYPDDDPDMIEAMCRVCFADTVLVHWSKTLTAICPECRKKAPECFAPPVVIVPKIERSH